METPFPSFLPRLFSLSVPIHKHSLGYRHSTKREEVCVMHAPGGAQSAEEKPGTESWKPRMAGGRL